MLEASKSGRDGILEPIWRLLDNVLAAAKNRIELFQVEAQEEKIRLAQMLLLTSAITVLGTIGIALGIFAVVIWFWEDGVLIALAMLSAVCVLGAGLAWRALNRRLRSCATFAGFSEELRKDRQCIPRP
jgi:uncharacterized membrane protein YqjE